MHKSRHQQAVNAMLLKFCRNRLNVGGSASKSATAHATALALGGRIKLTESNYEVMWRFYERYQGIDGIAKQIDEIGIAPESPKIFTLPVKKDLKPKALKTQPVPNPHTVWKPKTKPASTPAGVNSDEFLRSFEWRQLRMVVLKKRGARCECCGASPKDGIVIHVDHIKPRRRHPELALTEANLQVLCEVCNHGKGSWDDTDWRAVSQTSGESSADSPVTRSGDGDGKLKSPVVPWPRLNKAR